MAVSGERDLDRAKDLRKRSKDAKGSEATRILETAANRLERRGATKLSKLGRRKPKAASDVRR